MIGHELREEVRRRNLKPIRLAVCLGLLVSLAGCGYLYIPPGAQDREALEQHLSERQENTATIRLSDFFGQEWTTAVIVCHSFSFEELQRVMPSDLAESDLIDTDALSRIVFYDGSSFRKEVTFGEDLITADRWLLTVCPLDAELIEAPITERTAVIHQDQDSIRLTRQGEVWAMMSGDFGDLRRAAD